MQTKDQDSLSQILKAEEAAKKKIDLIQEENEKRLNSVRDVSREKEQEVEEKAKKAGNDKIMRAQEEAKGELSEKLAASTRERDQFIREAEGKKERAVSLIADAFTKYIS